MYFNNCWSFEHILFFEQNSAIAYYYENVKPTPAITSMTIGYIHPEMHEAFLKEIVGVLAKEIDIGYAC